MSRRKKVKGLNKANFLEISTLKVVMHATETCYGLAADIFSPEAVQKLYKIKQMDPTKPVSIMVRNLKEAKKYAQFGYLAEVLAKKFWPGPLTMLLPRKPALPEFFNPGHKKVGIRCPDSEISRMLIEAFDGPLTTTSANISGKEEVYDVNDYLKQIEDTGLAPDVILDSGKLKKRPPSTIIDFQDDELIIVREGSLAGKVVSYLEGL